MNIKVDKISNIQVLDNQTETVVELYYSSKNHNKKSNKTLNQIK
jgi:hypothetical protein